MSNNDNPSTIYLLGHAHIDLAYRWRWNEVVHRVGRDTFRGVLALMEADPTVTFVQSQMALYEAMAQAYPEIFAAIKQRISEGRWFAVDGWVEYDHTMPCGEAMIRQHLIGSDYARRELGVKIDMAWAADAFSGHTHTLPTILAGCGIKYMLFGRGMPQNTPYFHWEGPDGSRIIAYSPVYGYGGAISETMIERLDAWQDWDLATPLMLYGRGDHGGGPREEDLVELARLRELPDGPTFKHVSPQFFFEQVLAARDDLPVYRGDLGNPASDDPGEGNFAGSVSSEGRNKQRNRQAENLLLTAERFATMSIYFQRKPCYPRVDFEDAWKSVLHHQFHDELPGTSRGHVFEDNAQDYDRVDGLCNTMLDHALAEISARVCTEGEGTPIMVYNPLAWTRSEPIELTLRLNTPPAQIVVQDTEGHIMPTQVLAVEEKGHFWYARVLFVARNTPSLGYKLFRAYSLTEAPALSPDEAVSTLVGADTITLESDMLRLVIDQRTGHVTSLYDKRLGREVLSGPANLLQAIRDRPGDSSGWKIALTDQVDVLDAPESIELVEWGPVRATVRANYRYQDSYFELKVGITAGLPRAQFRFIGDWYERDCALKVAFPVDAPSAQATFEQPFGAIARPANGQELPAQRWVDAANESQGAALLNDCRYAFDIKDQTMRMTLLRGIPDLDPLADEGHHELDYALYAHSADWQAEVVRQGFEANYALLARQPMKRAGLVRGWGMPGPNKVVAPTLSFMAEPPENIVLTALKVEHEDWGQFSPFVIRLYETAGKETPVTLRFPRTLLFATETDHLERPLPEQSIKHHGNEVSLTFQPYEIKTLHLAFLLPSFAVDDPETISDVTIEVPEEADTLDGA